MSRVVGKYRDKRVSLILYIAPTYRVLQKNFNLAFSYYSTSEKFFWDSLLIDMLMRSLKQYFQLYKINAGDKSSDDDISRSCLINGSLS